jgi:LysM repeat protein
MRMNSLNNDSVLLVGQKLRVKGNPKDEQSGATDVYVVQQGDSLSKIAKKHGISLQTLRSLNTLSSDKILVGQKINVPMAGSTQPRSYSSGSAAEQHAIMTDGNLYIVQPGDTLSSIASRLHMRQSDLQRLNNLNDPNRLRVGQKLVISGTVPAPVVASSDTPKSAPSLPSSLPIKSSKSVSGTPDMYTIKSGDTISKIAKELNVSQEDLIELNSIDNATSLQAGKKLLIPKKSAAEKQPAASKSRTTDGDFFDNFEEIPVIEIN